MGATLGGQLIPETRCSGWKRFWNGHYWCFPQWCRYGYRRGGPEKSWRCVSWKNSSKVQRLPLQYLCSTAFEVPWKQLWQFWNRFDGEHGASAGRLDLAWCGSTETLVQQLEQGCSEPTEGEQDLMQTWLQEENYNSRASESRLWIIATVIVFAASVVRGERMWRRARMWKCDDLKISETYLSKDIWEST